MKKRCSISGSSVRMLIPAVLFALLFAAMACGCSKQTAENAEEPPFSPVSVYDDGVYAVVLTGVQAVGNDGQSEQIGFALEITNKSTDSMALSSVLGIRVAADGQQCSLVPVPAEARPVDGLIDAGCSREGQIIVCAPVQAKNFTVELAVDYLGDQWISFSVSR